MRKHSIPVVLFLAALAAIASSPAAVLRADPSAKPRLQTKPATKSEPKAAAATAKAATSLLPEAFSGWEAAAAGPAKPITNAAEADAVNAAALAEYGFTDAQFVDYTRNGESLKIKALRFTDASGAYGAYTFYRHSTWPKEEIGSGAASDNNRVLFWIGNVLIDAEFPRITGMSAAQMRELAKQIPQPSGNRLLPPPTLGNLPTKALLGQSTHYALGSVGYLGSTKLDNVLPPEMVGFDRGAESVTATYNLLSGPATLTVINYPTPQMAAVQEKTIAAYLKAGNTPQHPFTKALLDANTVALEVKRVGPLVAIVSGTAVQSQAHSLLESVHYETDIASVPQRVDNEVKKTAKVLLGIVTIVIVMAVAALLLALFLGGFRATYRVLRGKPASSVFDEEFTKLDL